MATIIMLANQKGGVGKTTATLEISYVLSQRSSNNSVLMIDLDAQCNLTQICGAVQEKGQTVYDTIMGMTKFSDAIQNIRPNLDILAGNRKMLSQYFVGGDDVYALKEAMTYINEYKKYDYIIIDVGPEGGQLMTMAMIASDYVIAVTTLANLGYSGVVQMCADMQNGKKHYNNFNVKPLGILINSVKKNNVSLVNRDKYTELAEAFGAAPFDTEIKNSCVVDECKEFQKALNEYKPNSELAVEFQNVVKEIVARIGGCK